MGGLSLLRRARLAGLSVWKQDDRVLIEGPCELDYLARQVLDQKSEVLAALDAEQAGPWPVLAASIRPEFFDGRAGFVQSFVPPHSCFNCGATRWWRARGDRGTWHCLLCFPPIPALNLLDIWPGEVAR